MVWFVGLPFTEDGFQKEAGQEDENTPRELGSWSIRVWSEKVFQAWEKVLREHETCCGRPALREWSRNACTCSGKGAFMAGPPYWALPGGLRHLVVSTQHGRTSALESTAKLKGDLLPFSLYIPFTATRNRDFYVTWRAEVWLKNKYPFVPSLTSLTSLAPLTQWTWVWANSRR